MNKGGAWPLETDKVELWAYANKIFTEEECQKIINYGTNFEKGLTANEHTQEMRSSDVFWIYPHEETFWVFHRLSIVVTELNNQYFGFDLFGITEGLQLTKYEAPKDFYDAHTDKSYGAIPRKLSITVQLSNPEDYEGGDLLLHTGGKPEIMQKELSKLIAFPSYTLHEVTPVTKGTRYSLVTWVSGKPFK